MQLLTTPDYMKLPEVPPSFTIFYGTDENQFGDLYLPTSDKLKNPEGKSPVVIMVHGGCWLAEYGLKPLGQLCQALCDRGYAVWNFEYRRLGCGGGWPTTFQDAAKATDVLQTLAFSHPLDLNRVIASGHSAGGHLASWIAGRYKLQDGDELFVPDPLKICGVISLAGIPDMEQAVKQRVCDDCPANLMGGTIEEFPKRYKEGSPKEMAPLGIPQIYISGIQDPFVPIGYVDDYVKFAQALPDNVELWKFDNAGHFEVITPSAASGSSIFTALDRILCQQANL